jgi:hypothetical protein
MRFEALGGEALPRIGDVFLVGVGANLDMIGLRPQQIFVNYTV